MDIVFLGIFYKLGRLYLCVGVDREYLPQEVMHLSVPGVQDYDQGPSY